MSFSEEVIQIFNTLKLQKSLAPSTEVSAAFSNLVELALQNQSEEFSEELQAILPELHKISAVGEYELENYWANRIVENPFPMISLEEYPYYHNYELLTQLEYQSLRVLGERSISKILFIGSGPLPLAAIILAKRYGISVVCIDTNTRAVELSTKLIKVLGLESLIQVIHRTTDSSLAMSNFQVVFVAALVGINEKEKVRELELLQASLNPGTLVVIRTAHGNRRLLYPFLDERKINNLKVHAVILPQNEVVNSVIIAEKPIADAKDITILDKKNPQTFKDFRSFAFNCISEQYNFRYNPLWHSDIDSAEETYGAEKANLFTAYVNGKILASIAIRPLEAKHAWLKDYYNGEHVGSVWRYFIDPQYAHTYVAEQIHLELESYARSVGYTKLYAHEQAFVSGALGKYIRNGYKPFREEGDQLETIHIEKKI